jgi:hypothetical protein
MVLSSSGIGSLQRTTFDEQYVDAELSISVELEVSIWSKELSIDLRDASKTAIVAQHMEPIDPNGEAGGHYVPLWELKLWTLTDLQRAISTIRWLINFIKAKLDLLL